jgi:hypothetical protein
MAGLLRVKLQRTGNTRKVKRVARWRADGRDATSAGRDIDRPTELPQRAPDTLPRRFQTIGPE